MKGKLKDNPHIPIQICYNMNTQIEHTTKQRNINNLSKFKHTQIPKEKQSNHQDKPSGQIKQNPKTNTNKTTIIKSQLVNQHLVKKLLSNILYTKLTKHKNNPPLAQSHTNCQNNTLQHNDHTKNLK